MQDMCRSSNRHSWILSIHKTELAEKFCYNGDTIGARRGTAENVLTRI